MFQKRYSIVLTAAVAVAALLLTVAPASAARYGGNRGGYRGGNSSGYYGGRSYGNYGYNNYGGYRPGISIGIGGYPGYYSSGYDYSPRTVYASPQYYYTPPTTFDPNISQASYSQPDDRAHLEVRVPTTDAQIFFDGDRTQQQGMERAFVSPPLTPGKSFTYTIEARWMENGSMVKQSRSVTVSAGQSATVDFSR